MTWSLATTRGLDADDDLTQWSLDLDAYTLKNSHIVVVGEKTLG
jgi:hypothetical protein